MPPTPRQSRWRDDETWQARVAADNAELDARLSDEQKEVLAGVGDAVGAGDPDDILALDFLVVFGSYARGDHGPNSDLDVYFEAANLPERFNRVDANRHYQVFGMPRGALLDDLQARRPFGPTVVRDALVVHDQGRFRAILISFDEGEPS